MLGESIEQSMLLLRSNVAGTERALALRGNLKLFGLAGRLTNVQGGLTTKILALPGSQLALL
jgi:hypothetical protein